MGIAYKARQLSSQRLVAIKVVPYAGVSQPQVIARFHQERLLAARLAHPNLVAAHDGGGVAGLPYFVMEFVDGTGLDALVRQQGPLPVTEACEVGRQAALGLQHIREHGLVHRDVKPSNLMLTPFGLEGPRPRPGAAGERVGPARADYLARAVPGHPRLRGP
jgi:serine/threonine protein kinase